MLKKFSVLVLGLSVFAPMFAFAQNVANDKFLIGMTNVVAKVLGALVPIIIGLAIVYFMWGVVSYITSKSEETKKEGKNRIIYGFIALFIITSFWGVIKFMGSTTGINQTGGATWVNCLIDPSQC